MAVAVCIAHILTTLIIKKIFPYIQCKSTLFQLRTIFLVLPLQVLVKTSSQTFL